MVDTTSTSITIAWEDPEDVGRPDYYYVIEYSDPDDASIYHRHNENGIQGNNYTLDNLRPYTIYIIRVTVHNGVSNQDPENANDRMVSVKGHTAEGRKYTVSIICIVYLSIYNVELYRHIHSAYVHKSAAGFSLGL